MKEMVFPGQMLQQAERKPHHTYAEKGKLYSSIVGIYDTESGSITPLEGSWKPRIGDIVVGVVVGARAERKVYNVDLCYHGNGLLIEDKFSRSEFGLGDVLEVEVKSIENKRNILLERPKLLKGGTLMRIKPSKVPRVIGRSDTMIKQIAELTNSTIAVGTNGIIWLNGGNIAAAKLAILTIEREAHTQGLTAKIKDILVNKNG